MPSSTSSSDTDIPYRDIPDHPWAQLVGVALVLLIIALLGWEYHARTLQFVPGTYDEELSFTAHWARERAKLDNPDHGIRLVLAGSSRILWAADLDVMEKQVGHRPLQLAIPGTSPALMVEDIVNNTDFDGLILVGATPFLFNRLDEGVFGKDAFAWRTDKSPSQYIGLYLHDFLSEHLGFLSQRFKLFTRVNFEVSPLLPVREGAEDLMDDGGKLGDMYADRQTDMWPPVEEEGSFENQLMLNFWIGTGLDRPPESAEELAAMAEQTAEYFRPLVETLRARGGDMVFVRMPSDGRYLEHDIATDYDRLGWLPFVEAVGATGLNTMDIPELSSELNIPEWSHLSRASQDEFSRQLWHYLEPHYAVSGRTLNDVFDGTAVRSSP